MDNHPQKSRPLWRFLPEKCRQCPEWKSGVDEYRNRQLEYLILTVEKGCCNLQARWCLENLNKPSAKPLPHHPIHTRSRGANLDQPELGIERVGGSSRKPPQKNSATTRSAL